MTLLMLSCTGIILYFVSLIVKSISTKQSWPWLWLISIIGLSILLFLILIAFEVISASADLKGFSGNVVAEGIGIALTVFIIDRLIKRREENRLLATKQIVYARLLQVINRPLEAMSQLFPGEYCKSDLNIYTYSSISIASYMIFDNLSTLHASIATYVERDVEERSHIQSYPTNITIMHSNIYNDTLLSAALDHIHQIISSSNFLIEPELTNLLLGFDLVCANLKRLTDWIEKSPIPPDEIHRLFPKVNLVDAIEQTMRTAVNVRAWLTGRADHHITEEY